MVLLLFANPGKPENAAERLGLIRLSGFFGCGSTKKRRVRWLRNSPRHTRRPSIRPIITEELG
jgi:hypothetical protein